MVLFYAIYQYCSTWPRITTTEYAFSRSKRIVVMILTTLDVGLFYVDHIHFQYNGMLLGLLILSATKFRQNKDLQGAFLYTVLLMMKHIYLYVAPLYFVYLLGHYCYQPVQLTSSTDKLERKRSMSETDVHESLQSQHNGQTTFSLVRFLMLGGMVLGIIATAFLSVLYAHPSPVEGIKQIFSRLFPVQRGLCHAYWAPNIWALYAFMDKVLVLLSGLPTSNVGLMSGGLVQEAMFAILPSVSPLLCAVLTFCSMLPVLYSVWKYPDSSLFMSALVYCMHCSFMFGYHVHEKAILQVLLPMALLSAESVNDMRVYRFASIISTFSLFPLLFTPAEHTTKLLLGMIHALVAYTTLDPFLKASLKQRHIKTTGVRLHMMEKSYLILVGGLILFFLIVFPLLNIGTKYPFLPLLSTSVTCAVANCYVWLGAMIQHYRKLGLVQSYLLDPQ